MPASSVARAAKVSTTITTYPSVSRTSMPPRSQKHAQPNKFGNVDLRKLERRTGNQHMKTATQPQTSKPTRPSNAKSVGRLFFLEASGGRIHSANADGSDRKVVV